MIKTFEEFETAIAQFAIYPEANTRSKNALAYCALGLTGEAGEYSEKIKKLLRDGTLDRELSAKELGDVLWYVTRSANELGYTLDQIANENIKKLSSRQERGVLRGSGDAR